jgi:hypothetical protein
MNTMSPTGFVLSIFSGMGFDKLTILVDERTSCKPYKPGEYVGHNRGFKKNGGFC